MLGFAALLWELLPRENWSTMDAGLFGFVVCGIGLSSCYFWFYSALCWGDEDSSRALVAGIQKSLLVDCFCCSVSQSAPTA